MFDANELMRKLMAQGGMRQDTMEKLQRAVQSGEAQNFAKQIDAVPVPVSSGQRRRCRREISAPHRRRSAKSCQHPRVRRWLRSSNE